MTYMKLKNNKLLRNIDLSLGHNSKFYDNFHYKILPIQIHKICRQRYPDIPSISADRPPPIKFTERDVSFYLHNLARR